jgi:hypothetical protein
MSLSQEFTNEMFGLYNRALKEARYKSTYFLDMLTRNSRSPDEQLRARAGEITAKMLINTKPTQSGFTAMYQLGPSWLRLTVEATIVENPKWHPLFTAEELERAEKRLIQHGYQI